MLTSAREPSSTEGCSNCTVTVTEPVTTGTAEVINCQFVTVHIDHRIPTIQVAFALSHFAFVHFWLTAEASRHAGRRLHGV
jgi:hypothetical protein